MKRTKLELAVLYILSIIHSLVCGFTVRMGIFDSIKITRTDL